MATDGKSLENLVSQIEELLLPQGFTVKSNRTVFDDHGVAVAEFDVEISGRIGSTDMSWLLECRDRALPAPSSWIEQLVGRRDRFGFNKVMAVSTSGFTPGAVAYAAEAGIELRTVAEISVDQLPNWLGFREMTQQTHNFRLTAASLIPSDDELPDRIEGLKRRLAGAAGDSKLLHPVGGNGDISVAQAFANALEHEEKALEGLVANGPPKTVKARVRYTNDEDHFIVDTDAGPVRIREIHFKGEVSLAERRIPFDALKEYRRDRTNETIAQTVTFPLEYQGSKFAFEMHKLADTGETVVVLRKLC